MDDLLILLSTFTNQPAATIGVLLFIAILAMPFGHYLTKLVSKLMQLPIRLFWVLLAKIGCIKGFRWFAIKAYLNTIHKKHGKVINVYLDREDELDLEKIFVPLTLHQNQTDDNNYKQTTREILTDPTHQRLMILGDPGSGKSTLLKALSTGVSKRQWPEFKKLVPVFVSLRAFAQQKLPFFSWLTQHVLSEHGMRNATPLLKKLVAEGRLLLLLDGLDEVNDKQIGPVLNEIFEFLDQNEQDNKNRVLMTCREQNYDLIDDNGIFTRKAFQIYRLGEMKNSELEAMVYHRQPDFDKEGKDPEKFLKAIYELPQITQLYRNPLLLTLAIALYIYGLDDKLPRKIAEFYDKSLDHLLRRHDFREQKKLSEKNIFEANEKLKLLKKFALANLFSATEQNQDFEEFSIKAMIAEAQTMAQESLNIKDNEAKPFVQEIQKNAGLIKRLGDSEKYVYAHRSIQEYCAAKALAQQGEAGFDQLWPNIENPRWRQTIIFYCSIEHDWAAKLVAKLLAIATDEIPTENQQTLLSLAGYCAASLSSPFESLREQVINKLSQKIESATPEHRLPLLVSVITIGRSAPANIKTLVNNRLKQFVSLENPQQFARELSRLDKDIALTLLEFMANDSSGNRQESALIGLNEIEGIEKIDLLWYLLAIFTKRGDKDNSALARQQLLDVIGKEDGAMLHLNNLSNRFEDSDIDEEDVRNVYPFLAAEETVSNFSILLTFESAVAEKTTALRSMPTWSHRTKPWLSFLAAATDPKYEKNQQQWYKLPSDRKKTILWFNLIWVRYFLWSLTIIVPVTMWQLDLLYWKISLKTLLAITLLSTVIMGVCILKGKSSPKIDYLKFSSYLLMSTIPLLITTLGTLNLLIGSEHLGKTNAKVSLNEKLIVINGSIDTLLWDIKSNKEILRIEGKNRFFSHIMQTMFSSDSKELLIASSDGEVLIWDIVSGIKLRKIDTNKGLNSAEFSPDNSKIITSSTDDTARIWDAHSGLQLLKFDGHSTLFGSDVKSAKFSPNGQKVITSSNDDTALVWKTKDGTLLLKIDGHDGNWDNDLTSAQFSPTGDKILTSSTDNTVRVWEAATGKELLRMTVSIVGDDRGESAKQQAYFSPNGLNIIAMSYDNSAAVFSATSGKNLFTIEGDIYSANYSPDGKSILTGSTTGGVHIWDGDTGQLLQTIIKPHYFRLKTLVLFAWIPTTIIFLLLLIIPNMSYFDRGKKLYIRKPNPFLPLYDLEGIENWLPPGHLQSKKWFKGK